MNFELGKKYIVNVSEKGIIPLQEFDYNKWYHKDYDDLDFLTDEEKIAVINKALDEVKAEIEERVFESLSDGGDDWFAAEKVNECLEIIDECKAESEADNGNNNH